MKIRQMEPAHRPQLLNKPETNSRTPRMPGVVGLGPILMLIRTWLTARAVSSPGSRGGRQLLQEMSEYDAIALDSWKIVSKG